MSSCMVGLVVFNDNDETVTAKIEKAVARYRAKYGRNVPTTCLVNVGLAEDPTLLTMKDLDIIPVVFVRPNNFWVGVLLEEKPEADVKAGHAQVVVWERPIQSSG